MASVKSYSPGGSVAAAKQSLENIKNKKPTSWTGGTYRTQLEALAEKLANREPFRYDTTKDTLYQNYKDQYQKLGKQAMKDTIGQAASLTGGYGNSYGQNVGQQAYDSYLQKLGEIVPSLYQNARDAYDAEGNNLLAAYNLAGSQYDREYGEYADALANWYKDVSAAQSSYEDTADRDYEVWSDQTAREEEQSRWEEELRQAAEEAAAELALNWAKLNSSGSAGSTFSSSGSSGSSSAKSYSSGSSGKSSSSGTSSKSSTGTSSSASSKSSSGSGSSQTLSANGRTAYSTLYNMKSKGATTAALKSKLNQLISAGKLTSYDQSYIRKKLSF